MKIMDVHRHFFFGKAEMDSLVQELEMDEIKQTVLFGYHGMNFFKEPHKQDEQIFSFFLEYPDKILPFFCDFDLYASNASEYIRRCADKGFFGMGEILLGHTPSYRDRFTDRHYCDEECVKAFYTAGECGLPVLVHADPEFMDEFLQAAEQCPDTKFILAHMGYDFMSEYGGNSRKPQELEAWLLKYPNLFTDISSWKISASYLAEKTWQTVMENFSERILIGFDMSEDYLSERVWIPAYRKALEGLSKTAQENICQRTLQSLLPLKPRIK